MAQIRCKIFRGGKKFSLGIDLDFSGYAPARICINVRSGLASISIIAKSKDSSSIFTGRPLSRRQTFNTPSVSKITHYAVCCYTCYLYSGYVTLRVAARTTKSSPFSAHSTMRSLSSYVVRGPPGIVIGLCVDDQAFPC